MNIPISKSPLFKNDSPSYKRDKGKLKSVISKRGARSSYRVARKIGNKSHAKGQVLLSCSRKPLSSLVKRLKIGNAEEQQKAAKRLGEMGVSASCAVLGLVKALFYPSFSVSLAARSALIKMGPGIVPEIFKAFKHKGFKGMVGWLGMNISEIMTKMGGGVSPYCITALRSSNQNVKKVAAYVLSKVGSKSVRPLLQALNDKSIYKRIAGALGRFGPGVATPLITRLSSAKPWVREGASIALGLIRPKVRYAIPHLIRLASRDRSWKVRFATVRALGRIGAISESALKVYISLLNHGHYKVREMTIFTLKMIRTRDSRVFEGLMDRLRDKNGDVRAAAAFALGFFKGRADLVRQHLKPLLNDRDTGVMLAARSALIRLNR
ncbi:MAG: HEAT repeat domain-containing protein [Pseudomonadota bacterium]